MTGLEIILAGLMGILAGRFMPARKKLPEEPKPICGCHHHYSMHDPKTGKCHALMDGNKVAVRDAKGGVVKENGYVKMTSEKVPCGCQVYSGPQPMPLFIAGDFGMSGPIGEISRDD